MKKITFLFALLCASVMAFAQEKNVNFALASNGSSATASSGTAANAIDGNEGTRWESAATDDETWTLDMGQVRTFNTIKIKWEGAFAKEYTLSYSNDGETWTEWYVETNLTQADWQTIYKETTVSAQYIRYHGTKRATGYGQSFWEFQVMYADAPKVYTQIATTLVSQSEGENDAARAIDGNAGTEWQGRPAGVSGGDEASRTFDAWFVVDLSGFYDIEKISIKFEGACSQAYHIDFSVDNTNWVLGYNFVGTPGVNGHTDELTTELDNNTKVRYVRFWSTKAATEWGMKIFEFQVFGKDWVPAGDTEKPVMVSASLVSKTWNSAVMAVAATDNNEVAKFHVVDATNAIDAKYAPTDGKITVTGLTAETAYNFTITALDASQNESDNSMSVAVTTEAHLIVPNVAAPVPTWDATLVKSLYSDAYDFAPASLNSYNEGWWDNPTMTEETIGEDHYLHYNLYRNGMIGVQFAEVSVATMEKVHIDVFASEAGSVTFRLITAGDAEAINNTKKTLNLQAGQWNSFDFDLSEFGDHNWTRLFQYAIEGYQDGGLVGEHISVDNVYCYRTSAWVDTEVPTNVSGSMASASYFSVVLALSAEDNSGAVSFVVKNGGTEVATGSGASGATVNITVNGLTPNTNYTFSVIAKDDAGNEADAISVVAQTAAGTPAAAPAPNFSEKVAVPVFCDALEDNPAIAIGGWGQSTQAQKVQLAEGDNVYYGTNFNYLGWELNPAVNATDMEKLHVDFFSPNLTSISITPISPGKEGVKVIALTANKWNSVDIDLSDYSSANIVWSNIFQMKFMDAAPAGGELFIDNVYFWADSTGTAIDEVAEPVQVRKMIENGQLVIIKNGVRYNVAGQVIR